MAIRAGRLRYRFDLLLARGMWVALLWLGLVTLAAVLLSTLLLVVFGVTLAGSQDGSVLEDFWQSALRVLDTGTMAADVGWGRRVLALVITIVGLLIAGTLIGFIASGVEQRVERMQGGRSAVIESGHAVILGSSPRLPAVVQQLVLANAKRQRSAIVVLTDDDPMRVADEVRSAVTDRLGSRLVFRRGDPTRQRDLGAVALQDARTVIVLADEAAGDAGVVTAVLAAGAELGGFNRVPIVAELKDPETADSLRLACGGQVHPVVTTQSVARAAAIALREPGLNQVIEDLLDFQGCDLYVSDVAELDGVSFGELVFRYANARPIGRLRATGEVEINPHPNTTFSASDRLVIVADSDERLELAGERFSTRAGPAEPARPALVGTGPREQHILVSGWNALGTQLMRQWELFADAGSSVEIVYDTARVRPDDLDVGSMAGLDITLTPTSGAVWNAPDASRLTDITTIVLLCHRHATSAVEADSHTLLNLMLLRRALDGGDVAAPTVVVELQDLDNVPLARRAGADDYIVSDAIGSRLIAQLAVQPERRDVFLSLYSIDGPSLHFVAANELGLTGAVTGADIVASAHREGLLAIGWRHPADRGAALGLNPHANDAVQLDARDQIIVIG